VSWIEFISSYSNLCFCKSNFLKNGKYLSSSLHYSEYTLKIVADSCILNDAEWTLPHSVRCLYNGMSPPANGDKYHKVLLSQRLFQLIPWDRVLEKLVVAQLFKNIPAFFYEKNPYIQIVTTCPCPESD